MVGRLGVFAACKLRLTRWQDRLRPVLRETLWIALGFVVVGVGLTIASRAKAYGRIFGEDHFVEIARGAANLKVTALANVFDENETTTPREGPPMLVTGPGLAIVYTILKRGSEFVHHCSVSASGGFTAHAIGSLFLMFIVKLFGWPVDRAIFEVGKSTVHHGEVVLDQDAHEAWITRAVPEVTDANAAEFRKACMEARTTVEWKIAGPQRLKR
jgi:hypothetical protein